MYRHRQFVFAVLAAIAAFAALAAGALAGQPYTLTDLGNLGSSATATAVSTVASQPRVVGDGTETSGNSSAWYWTQGAGMIDLGPTLVTDLGSTGSQATGVNASGQIVGTYSTSSLANGNYESEPIYNGFVSTNGGTPTEMALPAGFAIETLSGINNNGLVAGWGEMPSDPTVRPFTYNVNTKAFTPLGTASGNSIEVNAVNATGWLAGQGGTSVITAYTWNGTAWNNLGSVADKTTYSYGIDANGDVVGYSLNSANKKMAFYCPYNGSSWGTPVDLGVIPSSADTASIAKGINDQGQIVGYEYATAISAATAFLSGTTSGSAVALSSLVSNTNGWTLEQATAIDNTGDIVGGMTNAYNVSDAFLLTNPLLAGDANGDGKVDVNDLTVVLSHFGQTGQSWSSGDFTGDGTVDVNDLTILLSHFGDTAGATAPGNVSAVPEPGALLLAAIGLLAALAGLRRRTA